ncbi:MULTISPECIES: patatin-like phospholipase family protein [unclassified Chelatococcus]|uniref:patatin-like phospholipase family protein n=1 Tax=unclassified Chelatococcus TaxID=2638111 RepID=UPI001BD0F105|nr:MULTISPECIES: patatin-like phospholipase family protein [unclassified Chelatococcus]MBS7698818.1 patatin-like phospholipase family protein [Chelatococcus sp. YT9]MBX3560093.1 patatin-like phospholipase family protein [Chelatococcus sp.]
MPKKGLRKSHRTLQRPPFDSIALLLQGGGALGSYQAGVYEALAEAELHPDWIAGISIGAINSAIIAGNAPNERVSKLRQFWEEITARPYWDFLTPVAQKAARGDAARSVFNQYSALYALSGGAPGFFTPRYPPPWMMPAGSPQATSYYDTSELRGTLERLIDFDRLNHDGMRLSVGAVNVRSGNFSYFDTATHVIRPEHIMASGALPPGFPAVEIDGEFYWDGGLVSNTPLQWVVQNSRQDTLAFQVDLWSARGQFPADLTQVSVRQKEVQFSSRTRASTDQFKRIQRLRVTLADFLATLPDEYKTGSDYDILKGASDRHVYNIVHLIYRSKNYEGDSKDYEFSRVSMEEHWRAGYHDAVRSLRHEEIYQRPTNIEGVMTFDCATSGYD